MKKLAIIFVMLLGSVATMQAQSFDFSCTATQGDPVYSQIDDGLSTSQIESIESQLGFSRMGEQGSQTLARIYCPECTNPDRYYIAFGEFTRFTDENGYETFSYIVNARYIDLDRIGGLSFHNNAEDAYYALLQIDPPSAQEAAVNAWNATQNTGVLIVDWDDASRFGSFYPVGSDTDYNISFFNGRWAAEDQSTEYSDAFGDTLAELMVIVLDRH